MVILLVCSCSRLGMYKENDFGYMMNDFYNCHFRYPKSSEDYCNMFYKNDSLNNFVFVRMMADTSEIHVKSYEEYNVFMDSIYDVHNRLGDYGIPHYFLGHACIKICLMMISNARRIKSFFIIKSMIQGITPTWSCMWCINGCMAKRNGRNLIC